MEFGFDVTAVLQWPITLLSMDGELGLLCKRKDEKGKKAIEQLEEIVNELGFASARAQGLRHAITSLDRLRATREQRIYIIRHDFGEAERFRPIQPEYDGSSLDTLVEMATGQAPTTNTLPASVIAPPLAHAAISDAAPLASIDDPVDQYDKNIKTGLTRFADANPELMDAVMAELDVERALMALATPEPSEFRDLDEYEEAMLRGRQLDPRKAHIKPAPTAKQQVLGMIKVGTKKLFMMDDMNRMHEMEPLCILDFYIHESCQRKGIGKVLFDHMLLVETTQARFLAYDRPSPKLLAFLARHYKLQRPMAQVNNFAIFREYGLNDMAVLKRTHSGQLKSDLNDSQLLAKRARETEEAALEEERRLHEKLVQQKAPAPRSALSHSPSAIVKAQLGSAGEKQSLPAHETNETKRKQGRSHRHPSLSNVPIELPPPETQINLVERLSPTTEARQPTPQHPVRDLNSSIPSIDSVDENFYLTSRQARLEIAKRMQHAHHQHQHQKEDKTALSLSFAANESTSTEAPVWQNTGRRYDLHGRLVNGPTVRTTIYYNANMPNLNSKTIRSQSPLDVVGGTEQAAQRTPTPTKQQVSSRNRVSLPPINALHSITTTAPIRPMTPTQASIAYPPQSMTESSQKLRQRYGRLVQPRTIDDNTLTTDEPIFNQSASQDSLVQNNEMLRVPVKHQVTSRYALYRNNTGSLSDYRRYY